MKRILLTMLAVSAIFTANAQEIGIKGGLNLTNWTEKYEGETQSGDMAIDFHLGAYAEFQINDAISFQPELLYSREGTKDSDEDVRLTLGMIQIPALVKWYVVPNINIHAGPQFGFILDSKAKQDGNSIDLDDFIDFNTVIISGAAGLGAQLSDKIEVGGRYNFNFSDLVDDGDDDYSTKGHVIQFFLAYRLK